MACCCGQVLSVGYIVITEGAFIRLGSIYANAINGLVNQRIEVMDERNATIGIVDKFKCVTKSRSKFY